MMRIGLLILTNLAVMVVFGFILSITGLSSDSIWALLVLAGLFGFGGAFVSLLFSKSIAIRSVGAEIITHPKNAAEIWLVETIERLAHQANIGMPDVAIYYSTDMNAFATGAARDASLVAVSSGLLANMDRNECEAVLAHEISHIANGDMVTMTLLQGVMNTFVFFLSRLIANLLSNTSNSEHEQQVNTGTYIMISMLLDVVFGLLASLIVMWFSRYREYRADAGSAKLVGKSKMIAALQRLKRSYEPSEPNSILAFCINGHHGHRFGDLFLSHPPLDKRIAALHELDTYHC